jgi:hypothetical protein
VEQLGDAALAKALQQVRDIAALRVQRLWWREGGGRV